MFADLPVTNLAATLKGYFKLAAASDINLWYRNFAHNRRVFESMTSTAD